MANNSISELYAMIAHLIGAKVSGARVEGFEDAFNQLADCCKQFQGSIFRLQTFTKTVTAHLAHLNLADYCAARLQWEVEVPQYELRWLTCQGRSDRGTLVFTFARPSYRIKVKRDQGGIVIKLLHTYRAADPEIHTIEDGTDPFVTLDQLVAYTQSRSLPES